MIKKAIIVDIDGTLSNSKERATKYLSGKDKDWDGFFKALGEDAPNYWCKSLTYWALENDIEVLLITSRPAEHRAATEQWLAHYGIGYSKLIMRPDSIPKKDKPSNEMKKLIYEMMVEPYYTVLFALDDRNQDVEMYRSIGITCLQCAQGDF